jgi:ABC-type transport system involved in multi-copper enzyme maturation permease subunit
MAFGGFNQLSGDIANRGLRYLLLRTGRLNIVVSRLLGTLVFSALTSLFTMVVVIAYLAIRYDIYPVGDLVRWGLYGWGVLNLFSLPYLALCTWISTAIASPFGALAIAQLAIGAPIVLIKYSQMMLDRGGRGGMDWLEKLTPWGWKFDLLHPDAGTAGLAAAVMLGFFALFFLLGARHFLKRDL